MDTENKTHENKNENIEEQIKSWRSWVTGIALILLGAYFFYFYLYLGTPASKTASTWGEFGDFFGGILNPLVAFAAFYWLTQSVKLQKTELAETRKALEGAEAAQKIQAANSDQNIRVSSRAALVNAIQSQITARKQELVNLQIQRQEKIELLAKEDWMVREFLRWRNNGSNGEFEYYNDADIKISNITETLVDVMNKLLAEIFRLEIERDKYLDELRDIVRSSNLINALI